MTAGRWAVFAVAGMLAVGLMCCLVAGGGYAAYRYTAADSSSRAAIDQRPREEMVVDLPDDGGMWSLTIVYEGRGTDYTSQDNRLRASFAAEPRLRSLVAQTHCTVYRSDNKLWQEKYKPTMGDVLPQLWLQDEHGNVAYKASGTNIPEHPTTLADELQEAIRLATPSGQLISQGPVGQVANSNCPGPNCPNPNDANRRPDGSSSSPWNRIPDIRPQFLRPASESPNWLLVAGVLIGFIVFGVVLAVLIGLMVWAVRR